jgi:hypothetical protein
LSEQPAFELDFDRWCATGWVRNPDDRSRYLRVTLRRLTHGDLLALCELHELVTARLPHPHILRSDGQEFMRRNLADRGATFGVFRGDELIAYSVVAFPGADEPCPSDDLPGIDFSRNQVAIYDGSGVLPDYRKNQLHATLNLFRKEFTRRQGRHHLYGTVSIYNDLSLGNHLSAGLLVRNITLKYGGMVRMIIHQDMRTVPVHIPGQESLVRMADVAAHTAALAQGLVGYQLVADGGEVWLKYSRFELQNGGNSR